GDLGDGEAGGLGGQGATARDARVHLDGDHGPVGGGDGELDVAAAGLDADLAGDGQGGVAHALVFLVGERLGGGDGDAVAGMHPHRVEVLDGADDDDVVGPGAHAPQLELLPADDRLLDEHLVDGAEVEATGDEEVELLDVVGDAAAGATEGETGAEHAGQADGVADLLGLGEGAGDAAFGDGDADLEHGLLELLAVLGLVDDLGGGADHLDVELREDAVAGQGHGGVEGGLPAEGGQEGVGAFAFDDAGDHRPGDRLDVGAVGRVGVGHDGRRVGVDQDDLVALLAQ